MAEEIKEPLPEFSEAEAQRIAHAEAGIVEKRDDEIEGRTFDLTDDELTLVTQVLVEMQERWFGIDFDLRTQMHFKTEIEGRFADIGLVARVLWQQAEIQGRIAMIPNVTFVDRVEGLANETDHERKYWDARNHGKLEEFIPEPLVDVAKKLTD